jgi:uncharacterized SAM-binding protein YcdF (DUF218 family)
LGVVAAGLLLTASLPVVSQRLMARLESVYPAMRVDAAPEAEVVLVLGGMLGAPVVPGGLPEWSEAVDRFEAGLALAQAGRARWLLFTAAARSGDGSIESEGAGLRRLAIARGLDPARVLLTGPVLNTADEVRELEKLAVAHGWKRVLLVSSAWHLPRAMRQFRGHGLEVVPFPVDYRSRPNLASPWLDWIPTAGALADTERALREAYGIAFYAVFRR